MRGYLNINVIALSMLVGVTVFSVADIRAQGCSDAGFCNVNAMKPTSGGIVKNGNDKNTIAINLGYGIAQYDVYVLTNNIEYSRKINSRIILSLKLGYSWNIGDFTNNHGFSDIFATPTYNLSRYLTAIGGIKIPLSDANSAFKGLTLPMSYQTSLGTTDLYLGLMYRRNTWGMSMAIQQPICQNNNAFISTDYLPGMIDARYISTNKLTRMGDASLRIYYNVMFGKNNFVFTPSILPIYHLANDRRIDNSGKKTYIYGSQGLTLNLNASLKYFIKKKNGLSFVIGAPVIARKARPEGLSQFSIIGEYFIKF